MYKCKVSRESQQEVWAIFLNLTLKAGKKIAPEILGQKSEKQIMKQIYLC